MLNKQKGLMIWCNTYKTLSKLKVKILQQKKEIFSQLVLRIKLGLRGPQLEQFQQLNRIQSILNLAMDLEDIRKRLNKSYMISVFKLLILSNNHASKLLLKMRPKLFSRRWLAITIDMLPNVLKESSLTQ